MQRSVKYNKELKLFQQKTRHLTVDTLSNSKIKNGRIFISIQDSIKQMTEWVEKNKLELTNEIIEKGKDEFIDERG